MTKNPQEGRKLQSKKLLVDAMYQLMQKKPYTEITITELCEEAGLCRRTFYRHFQIPADVLEYAISEIANEFFIVRNTFFTRERTFHRLTVLFFYFWEQRLDVLMLFYKNNLYYYFCDIFSKTLHDTLLNQQPDEFSDAYRKTYLFIFGGLCQLMKNWLDEGACKSPEEMGDYADTIYKIMR